MIPAIYIGLSPIADRQQNAGLGLFYCLHSGLQRLQYLNVVAEESDGRKSGDATADADSIGSPPPKWYAPKY